MDVERYDKVLILMALDIAYEVDIGGKYVKQSFFDKVLKDCGVDKPNLEYIENRLSLMMDRLMKELHE